MAEVLDLDLAELVSTRQVSVVQELDLGKLATVLSALQDAVNARPVGREGPSKEEFAALAGELAQLKQEAAAKDTEIKALKEQQASLAEQLGSKVGKDEVDPQDVAGLKAGLQALGDKVEEHAAAATAAAAAAGGGDGGDRSELGPRVEELADGMARLSNTVEALKTGQPQTDPLTKDGNASAAEAPTGVGPADVASLLARQQAAEAALAEVRDAQDGLRAAQDELRKAQKDSTNGADDAKAVADATAARLGEQVTQIEALRAAVEALNNGEKIELPSVSPANHPPVDLGPLERRVAQKADAEDVAAVEARLKDIESALRAARGVADDAARQSAAAAAQSAQLSEQMAGQTAPPPHSTHHTTTVNTNSAHTTSHATSEEVSALRAELAELHARIEMLARHSGDAASAADMATMQAELNALMKAMAGKASQADLDALMSSGAPLVGAGGAQNDGGGGGGIGEGDIDPDSATAASVALTVNGVKGQVAQLQAFLQVLQGRLEEKAGAGETESLRRGNDGLRETIQQLKETVRELQNSVSNNKSTNETINEMNKKISTIERRISTLEAMKPSPQSGVMGGGGSTGAVSVAGDGVMHLEAALRECQADLSGARSQLDDLKRQVEEMMALRADVDGAKSRQGALDSGLSTLREDVAGLRDALGSKADKSEVDALLQSGVSAGGGADAADSPTSAQLGGDADVKDAIPVLNDLSAQVAQLSSGLKVLRERVAGKADSSALDGKADRDSVSAIEAALAEKAEGVAVSKLRAEVEALRRGLNGNRAGVGVGSNDGNAVGGDGVADLRRALAGKAERGDVEALRELIDALTTGAAPTGPTPPGTGGAAEKMSPREMVANHRQQSGSGVGPTAGGGAVEAQLSALRRDMDNLAAAVEAIAHAANVMGVGPNDAMMPLNGQTHYPVDAASAAAISGAAGIGGRGADGAAGGDKKGASLSSAAGGVVVGPTGVPHGAADKLRDLLRLGAFNHKMDWFNPAWLEDLARRIGDLESGVRALRKSGAGNKPPSTAEMPGRSQGGGKDYDKMIMKLGKDIAGLKKSLAELGAPGGGGGGWGGSGGARVPDGDHAMLSSKPLFGYRCMACDRPLEKLDERPGPYIPTGQMPSSVAPYERRGIGVPVGIDQAPKPMHDAKAPHEHSANRNRAAGSDGRGPQNWYQDSHGPSAAILPRNDVGPHLPPGGWRGNDQGTTVGLHQRRNSRGSVPGNPDPGKLPAVPNGDSSPPGLQPKPSSSTEGSPTSLPSI